MRSQALILAAGLGTRLASAKENGHSGAGGSSGNGGSTGVVPVSKPKCLRTIGGRALIDWQLEALANAGIGPVTVVIGHGADEVRAALGDAVNYVVNPDPAGTNSLYSLWLARDAVKGPVIILNCDVFFHPALLDKLMDAGEDALLYDSSSGGGREHMKVVVREGRVVALGKEIPGEFAHGENVGCFFLAQESARRLFEKADRLIAEGRKQAWAPEAVEALAKEVPLRAVNVAGIPWAEIDFPYDLERASREVLPAVVSGRRLSGRARRLAQLAIPVLAVVAIVLAFGSRFLPGKVDWRTVRLEGGERVVVTRDRNDTQTWWLLRAGESVEAEVAGPGDLRIELRALAEQEAGELVGAAVVVSLDGEPLLSVGSDNDARRECGVRLGEHLVGKKDRHEVDLPEGAHRIRITARGAPGQPLLVRLRVPE